MVERKIVREVCLGLNEGEKLKALDASIQVEMWEDSFNTAESPQDKINRLIDECDIFVSIFHKRFSADAGKRKPGSLEEFMSAYDLWKTLRKPYFMFYFKELKIASMDDLKDPQINDVLKLREKIDSDKLLYCAQYTAPYEFCENIYNNFEKWITDKLTN